MASNMLKIPFRRSHPVSLSDSLAQYISSKYDQHPDMFSEDLLVISRLRTDAINVQEPHISGISRLVTYAAQLKWIGGKFPIDVGADFAWYPAFGFNTSRPVSQNNVRYELVNILFNLAALLSQLAVSLHPSDPNNLKIACKYFCQSAGVILHLRTDILPDLRSSPPEDMDEMTLRSLEELMLAQAQECFWQRAIKDGLKDASIARLAAKVSDFYANSGDFAVKSNAISTAWIHHMTAKHHHFAAAAQYRQSLDCLEKRKYGEEVARMRDSLTCANEALKEAKWINKAVLGDLNTLKARVSEDLKRAEKDNDMIYLNPVPPKSELKLLDRATMVAAEAPKEVIEALSMIGEGAPLGRPLFAKLVPYAVHVAASIYADRRDQLVNQTIGELESMTLRLRDLLQSLNLPGSLQALEKPLGLPPSLVSHAEEIRQQDGLNRLYRSLEDTSKLKANDKAIYTEGVELLMAEKEEDNRARTKYGTDRWTRLPSKQAAEKLYTKVHEFDGYLASADKSDSLVYKKLRESEHVLRVLTATNRELEAYVPSSRKATVTPQVERESNRLRGSLNDVTRLENRRKRKIEALREKAKADKIHSALVKETSRLEREYPMQTIEPGQFEDLFEEHLRLYDSDRDMLNEEQKNQTQIENQIREANKAFIMARKGDSSTKEREKALQDLGNGYIKYNEIISNIEGGRKFYNDLAKLVSRFREECKKFVQQRRMEASQMETDIANTTAMASLNITQASPPIQPQPPSPTAPQFKNAVPFSLPRQENNPPFTAPQPTRALAQAQLPTFPPPQTPASAGTGTSPAFPTLPSAAMSRMWSPEMGIRFGTPTQMSLNSRMSGPGSSANETAGGGGAADERRVSPGKWDPNRGLRFS
ncbi:pH signal transduction protein PalA [Coccidioides immitis RS]|uniref:pH signal transduction protein PalA n=1 Tax=Coccidioides immitis (strain RS) TaxID=246410 RepID=J3KCY1_COCIM|nr:pH signal transduction protein PalA [Coccidioides immitis RS]EAS33149.3 pH signal transduction protein PalA [Coccidioides immitis RS]